MPRGVVKRVLAGNSIELRSGEHVTLSGLTAPAIAAAGGEAAKRRLQRVLRRGTSIGLSDPVRKTADGSVRRVTKDGRDVIRLVSPGRARRAPAPAARPAARAAAKPAAKPAAKLARPAAKPAAKPTGRR